MTDHALVVPPAGIMQVLHHTNPDPEAVLRGLFPTEAAYVGIRFHTEGVEGRAGFFPSLPTVNPRAREALRILTDTHLVFTGPVIFTGVPSEQLGEVVATLSVDH